MGDLKFKFTGIILVLITISLIFQIDFKDQVTYVFDKFDIDIEELTQKSIEKVLSHATEEIFNNSFYTSNNKELIENEISEEKNKKLDELIQLSTTYNGILIRGYEVDDYIVARYYVENEAIDTVISEYKEKFMTDGFKEKDNKYIKDNIEINIFSKWDCVTVVVKGI